MNPKRIKIIALVLIFFIGFIIRFYKFDSPIADWHSWRQADTSAVSRNFALNGFDLLHPRFDDLSNVPSWPLNKDNPNGYRFVEFPIYNVLQAVSFKIFGVLSIEEWGRLVSIISSLLSGLFLYLIIKKRFGENAGLLTLFFYLFIPFNIYYSRTILPDPTMVMAILGGTFFFQQWLEKNSKFEIRNTKFLLSLLFTTSAFLLKPYALFFTLPMFYLAYEKFGISFLKKWQIWVYLVISLIPLIFWRIWMLQYPEGIPFSSWLFNGNHIRFRPSFFYWLFYERLIKLILGYFGIIILFFSVLSKYKRNDLLFILSFVLSSLIYVTTLATGNIQHDYYQILVIPSIAILLALGSLELIVFFKKYNKYLGAVMLILLIFISGYLAWNQVKDYFNVNNNSIVLAGIAVDKLTPKNAKVIAIYNGDTSFLYQTKRKGWASFEKDLKVMINMGANYLVLVNPTKLDLDYGKTYKMIEANKNYAIFNLNKKP